jgi:peptidoglycan/xylan/chitin deacetylase (PgdA/CDA1 family)
MIFEVHDVLQSDLFSDAQRWALKEKSFFEWFKVAMEVLKGQKVILAVVAEGIDKEPEWVAYIKQHLEWEVQLHCWEHRTLTKLSYPELYFHLALAKTKIGNTFDCNVTKFYPPKLRYNEKTQGVANLLGMEEVRNRMRPVHWFENPEIDTIYFHFWNKKQIEQVKEICRAQLGK